MRSTFRNWINSLVHNSLSYDNSCDFQVFKFLRIIMSCIVYSTLESFMHDLCSFFWHKSQKIEGFFCSFITDDIRNYIEFFWGDAYISSHWFHKCKIERKIDKLKLFVSWVFHKSSSIWEFTKFMSDHILCDKYRNMLFSIVNTKSVSDKFWRNSRSTSPSFDDAFFTTGIECFYFFKKTRINIWSFFQTTSHKKRVLVNNKNW